MKRRAYFELCSHQSLAWLKQCAANPSDGMTATHVRLVRLAIRKAGGDISPPFVDVSTITEYGLTQKLSNAVRVF